MTKLSVLDVGSTFTVNYKTNEYNKRTFKSWALYLSILLICKYVKPLLTTFLNLLPHSQVLHQVH